MTTIPASTNTTTPTFFSPGQIARMLEVPLHRVHYVIQQDKLEPAMRVGNGIRMFTEADVSHIAARLERGA
jgi:DNA-binding transcriptional MerR regulator